MPFSAAVNAMYFDIGDHFIRDNSVDGVGAEIERFDGGISLEEYKPMYVSAVIGNNPVAVRLDAVTESEVTVALTAPAISIEHSQALLRFG